MFSGQFRPFAPDGERVVAKGPPSNPADGFAIAALWNTGAVFSRVMASFAAIETNFRAIAVVQIVQKLVSYSFRKWPKTQAPRQPRFQASLIRFAEIRQSSRGVKQGRAMRFLLRLAFWLGLVLVLLPSGGSQPASKSDISTGDALAAAKAAVSDMEQFCARQREACTVGSQAAMALGHRAQAGAKMLYEFLNAQFGPDDTAATGALKTSLGGASAEAVPLPVVRPSQNTLTPADLATEWRGPQPPRDASSENPA